MVARGGVLGIGEKDLLRVPLSQLSYDPNNQHLQLNVSDTDLTRVSSAK